MKQILSLACIVLFMVSLFSCKDNSVSRRKISGKPGELVVVVPRETWDGKVGEAMKSVLLQPQTGLPQDEPLFTTIDIPPAAFKEIFKTTRNIINVRISPTLDSAKVEFKDDVWAWPQAVVNIDATTNDECVELFNRNADKILSYFLKAERDRLQMNYSKNADKPIQKAITDKFGIRLDVPVGYTIALEKDSFMWVRYDTPEITQSLAVYSFPYHSDSTFTPAYLLNKRDSVLANIEGPRAGSFMATERRVVPYFRILKAKNNYAAEMRGLWKMQHDFMGGPFVSLSVLDVSKNRVIVLDGFVYAPRFDKRNYVRQLEAIMYSLEFPHQDENDKMNSQIEMGN